MSTLLTKSGMIYDYIKTCKSNLKTYMTHKPMKNLSEKHVQGLGFTISQATKKDCKILLNLKEEDLRVKLILAHYSMNLMPAFLIEGCLSMFLLNEVAMDEYYDGKPVTMSPLYDIIILYEKLFRNEHFYSYAIPKEKAKSKVEYFVKKGYLSMKDDSVTVVDKESAFMLLNFFRNLIAPLIDTYLVTLSTIEHICGKNLVLKERNLVNEVHVCIKRLYSMNVVSDLHSCLQEIISTALQRFE